MKVSELIVILQKVVEEHGDLPVLSWDEMDDTPDPTVLPLPQYNPKPEEKRLMI